jgi:endonuclease/exonuclease/phosphatase family metal-dependent hydrolase
VAIPVRLVSYNVHSLRDDLSALGDLVRSLSPDIVVVQEAPRRFRWRQKCAALAHRFGLYYAEGGLPSLGNLIMTNLRVRVTQSWSLRYPLTPGRHMRGAAFAHCTVPGPGGSFLVAGTHLSTHDGERPIQAALLRPHLGATADPVILAADLNESDSGASWRLLVSDLVDTGLGGPNTFPATAPNRRIDAVFVSPSMKVTDYRVVTGDLAVRASDHLPIVVDLELPS